MKIHLHSRQGLYEVETYSNETITVSTKRFTFTVPVSDFKSFAGGNWNFDVSKEQMDIFLSIVQPETYKKQVELDNEIISLAKRIDMLDKVKELVKIAPVQQQVVEDNYDFQEYETTKEEYEKWWRQESDKNYKLNNKMRSIAHKVYSQTLDFTHFQNHDGIKFIIQANNDETDFRFCWDPYGFVDNGHSAISSIFRADDFYTVNGGWIRIIGDDVILYAKSGDYGVYDDTIATECAKKVFPTKNIHSFAGRAWDYELTAMFDDLPF